MPKKTPRVIELFGSRAYITYKGETLGGFNDSDGGKAETVFVNWGEFLILCGDHRREIQKIMLGVRFPYVAVREFFLMKEKEFGSSWSKNSSIEGWKLERVSG